jgi:hypothetical protein
MSWKVQIHGTHTLLYYLVLTFTSMRVTKISILSTTLTLKKRVYKLTKITSLLQMRVKSQYTLVFNKQNYNKTGLKL